ncbi:MAG TPA: hypothetical protein VHQ41_01855 [Patescibacteria group bacterium]|jgi:hypothetical protein|nr:hypothetical protein [Patescibacteria group bacterium]
MDKKTLLKIAAPPLFVLAFHILASIAGWYENFWWFDIPLHLMGGFAVVLSASIMLNDFKAHGKFNVAWKPLNILILIGFGAMAAIAWEILEFTLDIYFHTNLQASLVDTMKDMAMGIIGGGVSAILVSIKPKK